MPQYIAEAVVTLHCPFTLIMDAEDDHQARKDMIKAALFDMEIEKKLLYVSGVELYDFQLVDGEDGTDNEGSD